MVQIKIKAILVHEFFNFIAQALVVWIEPVGSQKQSGKKMCSSVSSY